VAPAAAHPSSLQAHVQQASKQAVRSQCMDILQVCNLDCSVLSMWRQQPHIHPACKHMHSRQASKR
jgi:hypothetical protein